MSNKFVSRFSSQRAEDIVWRINVAHVDAAIEGIERHPALVRLSAEMDAEELSVEKQIKRIIAFDLTSVNEAAE